MARVRLGLGWKLALASPAGFESPPAGRRDEVTVHRAYVRIAARESAFTATLGLAPSPFAGTGILWDRDIRFAGGLAGRELPPAGALVAQRVFGGVSAGSQEHEDESLAAAVRWEGESGGGFSFGAACWHFGRTAALVEAGYARTSRLVPGGGTYLSDFEIANVSGELQDTGTWRAHLLLQRVEQDAALAAFGGDEWWFRTEQRGAGAAFAFALHRPVFVDLMTASMPWP